MQVVVPKFEAQPAGLTMDERFQGGDGREILGKVASIEVASMDVVDREMFQVFQCSRRCVGEPNGP